MKWGKSYLGTRDGEKEFVSKFIFSLEFLKSLIFNHYN